MALTTTDTWLDAAEAALGRRLPTELRQRLTSNNGGELWAVGEDWEVLPVWDRRDRRHLTRTFNHLVSDTEACMELPGFPADAVSIARSNADRLILLAESAEAFGAAVYFWDFHEGTVEWVAGSVQDLDRR